MRDAVRIPVVANGEIWTVEDAQRCRAVSGCDALMLGRGMVADLAWPEPFARPMRAVRAPTPCSGPTCCPSWPRSGSWCATGWSRASAPGLKQWLNLLRRRYPEVELAFEHVRTLTDQREITRWIAALQLQAQG